MSFWAQAKGAIKLLVIIGLVAGIITLWLFWLEGGEPGRVHRPAPEQTNSK